MDEDFLAFRAALATDLLAFLERAFREIDPRGDLQVADYVLYLNDALQRVADGKDTRVILNLPPRHLKSILASIVWPAWLLGQDPKLRIAVVSHSQALARDLSLKTLRMMETDFYRDVFPQTRLRDDRRQAIDFETSQRGRYAASFETGITGRGFDLIIVDDPISAHAVRSSAERIVSTRPLILWWPLVWMIHCAAPSSLWVNVCMKTIYRGIYWPSTVGNTSACRWSPRRQPRFN